MKKVIINTILLAMMTLAMAGCSKNSNGNDGGGSSKLSPPSWIQGRWGESGVEIYKFTSDDVIQMSFSLKLIFTSTPVATHTFKETKTDALYEIKVTQKVAGKETGAGTFSFKKGDGSYIDVAAADDDEVIKPSDYTRMKKL